MRALASLHECNVALVQHLSGVNGREINRDESKLYMPLSDSFPISLRTARLLSLPVDPHDSDILRLRVPHGRIEHTRLACRGLNSSGKAVKLCSNFSFNTDKRCCSPTLFSYTLRPAMTNHFVGIRSRCGYPEVAPVFEVRRLNAA